MNAENQKQAVLCVIVTELNAGERPSAFGITVDGLYPVCTGDAFADSRGI